MRPIISSVLLTVLGASFVARADSSTDLDRQLAREPVEITTTTGRTVHGMLDGLREGRLFIRLATDGGEVGYSFSAGELAAVRWPGSDMEAEAAEMLERGDVVPALPMMEALARQRIRYLPLLDTGRQEVLWSLVQHGPTVTDPDRLQPVITALQSVATTAERRAILLEAQLELALRSDRKEAARALARLWCVEADPAGPSARGWSVLARLAYQEGDYIAARWYALQPVAFSSDPAMRDLSVCFALAIASAEQLGDTDHARVLKEEMANRQISAPQDVFLPEARAPHVAPASIVGSSADPPASLAQGGPEATARALEDLRKIPHRPEPLAEPSP